MPLNSLCVEGALIVWQQQMKASLLSLALLSPPYQRVYEISGRNIMRCLRGRHADNNLVTWARNSMVAWRHRRRHFFNQ